MSNIILAVYFHFVRFVYGCVIILCHCAIRRNVIENLNSDRYVYIAPIHKTHWPDLRYHSFFHRPAFNTKQKKKRKYFYLYTNAFEFLWARMCLIYALLRYHIANAKSNKFIKIYMPITTVLCAYIAPGELSGRW